MMTYLTKNFTTEEFECPCCGESHMNKDFMARLQAFRTDLGVVFSPVKGGGYRCPDYNGSDTGAHVEGGAIDPDFGREHYFLALKLAQKHGFTGIGIKQKKGKFQMHLDDVKNIPGVRPRPWVWTY